MTRRGAAQAVFSSFQSHLQRFVVPVGPDLADLTDPVAVVGVAWALVAAQQAPSLALVRPVFGLETVGLAEVDDRARLVPGRGQVLGQLK